MEHLPELTDTAPEAEGTRRADALARLGRFFRRPAEEHTDDSTAEFNVLDMRAEDPSFPVAMWGGYDRATVDTRIAELEDELAELRSQTDPECGLEREIRQLGDETAEILRVAHGKADALVKKAQADSEAIVAGAEQRAAEMVAGAEERLRQLDHDTDVVWEERTRLTEDTRRLAETLMRVADGAAERFPPEAPAH